MKKIDFIIRPANIADAENIHYVLSEAFKPYKEYYTKDAFNKTIISTDEIVKRYVYREGLYNYYTSHNPEIKKASSL